jgi:hypothetical protein
MPPIAPELAPAAGSELPDLFRDPPGGTPPHKIVRGIIIASIWFALGVVGWLVPFVTGIPFYIAGVVALALISRRVRRWINRWDRNRSLKTRLRIRRALHKVRFASVKKILNPYHDPRAGGADSKGRQGKPSQ